MSSHKKINITFELVTKIYLCTVLASTVNALWNTKSLVIKNKNSASKFHSEK